MILQGDCREVLAGLPSGSVHAAVTSPPYFRQRDYGLPAQIGQEATPATWAASIAAALDELRRVLTKDGVLWLNVGDSYAAGGKGGGGSLVAKRRNWTRPDPKWQGPPPGFKQKDLTLCAFLLADRLRAGGWWLRSTIVWDKGNAGEPPRLDRPSTSHEYLFLLSRSEDSRVRDPGEPWFRSTVWQMQPQYRAVGHPAVMSAEVARRCIVCSTGPGDHVLDPFAGSGTTGLVADALGRRSTLIELNPDYVQLARLRLLGSYLGGFHGRKSKIQGARLSPDHPGVRHVPADHLPSRRSTVQDEADRHGARDQESGVAARPE